MVLEVRETSKKEPAGMTTIGLSYSLVKISTKCAPALLGDLAQFGFQAAYLGLQGRLFELLVSRLTVLPEPGIQTVAGDPKGSCNVSHRPSALGDLFNGFDFECS